jgi:hypothetical protein
LAGCSARIDSSNRSTTPEPSSTRGIDYNETPDSHICRPRRAAEPKGHGERIIGQLTQACLSPWQINLAEIFSTNRDSNATEENLSRLESFLTTYFIFDRIYVPEEYRSSSFVSGLNSNNDVFEFDSRISGSLETDGSGQPYTDIDPSLLFKNRRHLRLHSRGWFKQHLVFDLSKKGREDLVEALKARGDPAAGFYQMILSEYQTMFRLSMGNDAFSVLFASVSHVYLPDIIEIPQFLTFLDKQIKKTGAPVQQGQLIGAFNFEFPFGAIEARIKIPPFFGTFLERAQREGFLPALINLRQSYEPLREAFRSFADEFRNCKPGDLVASDMVAPQIDRWNSYVASAFGAPDEALILKSEVAAIEIHAGVDEGDFYRTLQDRIKHRGQLLRFAPPQSFARFSRKAGALSVLNIKNVVPLERRLLRLGSAGTNKRRALHRGIGCIVSFPVSVGAQLMRAELHDPVVRTFDEESSPHLYMICTRPRITLGAVNRIQRDWMEMEFHFHHRTHTDTKWVVLPDSYLSNVPVVSATADAETRTRIFARDVQGKDILGYASLLYQRAVRATLPASPAPPLPGDEYIGYSEQQIETCKRLDLEVIYIGQSQGRDLERTAITRLGRHEKWDMFYKHIADENPHQEIWILLLVQSVPHHLNMTLPGVQGADNDVKELLRRALKPSRIDPAERINFIEAALINYFRPRYNDKFKKGAIPSRRHESYERLFVSPIDVAAVELETWTSIGCRLFSKSVEPRFTHMKSCHFNPSFDMKTILPKS